MATLPTTVQPGDIISSELMNAILAELARLGGNAMPTGTQVVPNVFGSFLGDARALILQPTRQLAMGFTFDVAGAAIDPIASANVNRIVLNQQPSANSLVAPGTPVNLVVSGSADTGTGPTPSAPVITGTETPSGSPSTSFAVGADLVIVGTGFSATSLQNQVRFAGVSGEVTADRSNPTQRLIVRVPNDIPGAPGASGDPDLPGVALTVSVGSGPPATTSVTISAPNDQQPQIARITPPIQLEGLDITIEGSNLAATAVVTIDGIEAPVVARTPPGQIDVTVPDLGVTPGLPQSVEVLIVVPAVGEAIFNGNFQVIPV